MAKLEVDVEGVERTLNEIKRDLHRGMGESADTLVDNARDRAREVIQSEKAIFNAEVYAGFRDAETKNTPSNVRVKLYNDVEHAEVLEDGAIFPAQGPPVEALLPWVARKMNWRPDGELDFHENEGVPDSFSSDDGDDDDDDGGNSVDGTNTKETEVQESLTVGDETWYFNEGWNTYDPTVVETTPRDETFTGQEVTVLNVETDETAGGVITHREQNRDRYTVELDSGEELDIYKPSETWADPYKIIGGEPFDNLSPAQERTLIEDAIDDTSLQGFDSSSREDMVRNTYKNRIHDMVDDKQFLYNTIHRTSRINSIVPDGSKLGSMTDQGSRIYQMDLAERAGQSTTLHENSHGLHRQRGFGRDVYPSNSEDWYANLFNADGTNATTFGDWTVGDVLLSTATDYPALPDDGSIPQIIRDRVEADLGYQFESISNSSELLSPLNDNIGVGDRAKITTQTNGGGVEHELVNVHEYDYDEFDYVGSHITAYEFREMNDDHRVEVWVDDEGNFVNMQGISIDEFAPEPDDLDEQELPPVELEREDEFERLIEASNYAFMEMVWHASVLEAGGNARADSVATVGRPYSMRAANEVFTTMSELMWAQNPSGNVKLKDWLSTRSIRQVHENYPYLIEAWLENFTPSPQVADILARWDYDV